LLIALNYVAFHIFMTMCKNTVAENALVLLIALNYVAFHIFMTMCKNTVARLHSLCSKIKFHRNNGGIKINLKNPKVSGIMLDTRFLIVGVL